MARGPSLHLYSVALLLCVVRVRAAMLQAQVYCFDRPTVYADGVLIGNNTGIDHHWTGEVADDTKLLAVKCYNIEGHNVNGDGFCGFMVSVVDILVSDKTWKCTTDEQRDNGWYGLEFKDDDWTYTSLLGGNRGSFKPTVNYGTTTLSSKVYVASFPKGIDFISHDGDSTIEDPTLFCRGRTGMALFLQHIGKAYEIYAEQQLVGSEIKDRATGHVWSVTVPRTTRLIAVALTHYASRRSHIAVRGPFGIKSTTRWRCSSTGGSGWNNITFDDSNWPDAIQQSGITLSVDVEGATPIWARSGSKIYCRGWIVKHQVERELIHKCKVTGNDFTCLCPDGHVLNGDKRTCRDCGCEYKCNVTGQDFTCLCPDGYVLEADNKTCRDLNECTEKSKDNPFIPLHDCNPSNQTCVNKPGSYECECRDGFTSYDNGLHCNDIDECVKGTHNCSDPFKCQNTFGSFICVCPDGYHKEEDSSGVSVCVDDNECNPQTPGIPLHDCDQHCNNLNGTYNCTCDKGYNLEADGRHCSDFDECVTGDYDCPETFNCTNTEGSYRCECRPGHSNVTKNGVSSCSAESTGGSNEGKTTILIGAAVSVFVVVVILVIVAFLLYRRRRRLKRSRARSTTGGLLNLAQPGQLNGAFESSVEKASAVEKAPAPETPKTGNDEDTSIKKTEPPVVAVDPVYSNVQHEAVSRPIKVNDFPALFQDMSRDDRFTAEFKALPSGPKGKCLAAEREGVRPKLRFKNVFPYDHSRVVLSTIKGKPLSDFINANYINGFRKEKQYIASQGPNDTSVEDFWRMMWEEDLQIIVMLTKCSEGIREKCYQYWPDSGTETFGDITVRVTETLMVANFITRILLIQRGEEQREATQFQYTTWPDKSVPAYSSALLDFRRRVKIEESKKGNSPMLVHCSAGVGRTGAFIAIDYLLEQAEAEGLVDVCRCVNLMRENRMNMIQTVEQYEFVYCTVLESLQAGDTAIPSENFKSVFNKMTEVQQATGKTGLEQQFEVLESMRPSLPDGNFTTSKKCADKNRSQDFLAGDHCRPYLRLGPGMESMYINAAFVDGYRSQREFIVTQMPLKNTRRDLWRLVEDFHILIIVMLTEEMEDCNYFGKDESPLEIDQFTVTVTAKSRQSNGIYKRDIGVKREEVELRVRHLQLPKWDAGDKAASLVTLFEELVKLQKERVSEAPILIQCLDGVERCGVFCALYCLLDKINTEHEVDVFNSVKKIRRSRPEFIKTLEQYRFLYDAAQEYLTGFETYATFK